MTNLPATSSLAPLQNTTFRAIWIASILSNFGGMIQAVGAGWMMTSLSDSANLVALVQASTTLPVMVFSLISGAIADGFDRRRIMLLAQFFMISASACLAVFAWLDLLTPWVLLGFTFLIGCGIAFNNPASQAAVGDIVPREDVPAAVLLNSVGFNVTRSIAPAIGGVIVAIAGAAVAFVINTLTYIGLIVVLWRWQPNLPERTLPREPLFSAVTTGMRYIAMSPNIAKVMLRGFIFGLTAIVVLALLPLVARDLIQGGAQTFGVLLGAFGVGAVAGAMISRPARERFENEILVRLAFIALAGCAAITALSTSIWLTGIGLLLGGAAWVFALSMFSTTVQTSTPRWVVGRAISVYQMSVFGGMALGSWLWGGVTEANSLEFALNIAALTMLAGAAMGIPIPLPSKEMLNLDPLNRWQAPSIALQIEPTSGPVAISIEYHIKAESIPEFMPLIAQRRRIRRRDGAHEWTLLRDMQNPEIWVERFEMPTWLDYLRFHMRTTHADGKVSDQIQALHQGAWPPTVRRMLIRDPIRSRTDPVAPLLAGDIHL